MLAEDTQQCAPNNMRWPICHWQIQINQIQIRTRATVAEASGGPYYLPNCWPIGWSKFWGVGL